MTLRDTFSESQAAVVVILDIDGTLLDSSEAHQLASAKAMADFNIDPYSRPLSSFRHFTDLAVLDELLAERRGHGASRDEFIRFEAELTHHFEELTAQNGLKEIAGASALLSQLLRHETVLPVFATGSARGAAKIKLRSLGIDPDAVILQTGSDFARRDQIIEAALSDAAGRLGNASIATVSIGDGIWDERTAHALDIPFIGVGGDPSRFTLAIERAVDDLSELTVAYITSVARPFQPREGDRVRAL